MARFCGKCGHQLGEQMQFCPSCGERVREVNANQTNTNPNNNVNYSMNNGVNNTPYNMNQPVKVKKSSAPKKILSVVIAVVILLVAVAGVKSFIFPGYLKPVKLIEKGVNDLDTDTCKNAFSDEVKNKTKGNDGVSLYTYTVGAIEKCKTTDAKCQIEFETLFETKLDKDSLAETLTSKYNVFLSDAQKAKAAYDLKLKLKVSYVDETGTPNSPQDITMHLIVAKLGFKWYVVGEAY